GVRDAGVTNPRKVPRRGLLAAEVPDRLIGVGEVVGEEPAAVHLGENARVAPSLARPTALFLRGLAWAKGKEVDAHQVTRLGALPLDRTAQHVANSKVDVSHVVGRVVVAELGVRPLPALDPELTAGSDRGRRGDVRMPPVVTRDGLIRHRLRLVHAE